MNNIESQIRNLRNEEEPYIGMSVREMRVYEDQDCRKCPKPEYRRPEYTMPEYRRPEYTMPECKKPEYTMPEYKRPEYTMPECKKPEYTKPECMESVCDGVDVCPLAMAYVPWQRWCKTFEPAEGHRRGTIFPELYLPWVGGGAL